MDRVIAYVDGFNLYYGLRAKGWRRLYWLDVHRLAENLLKPGQRLVRVHYFTARITSRPGDEGTRTRQSTYLDALETLDGVRLHYGHYLAKTRQCPRCRATWETFEEKMTDVNIAVELLGDARDDAFDTAVVVSGDSDLTKPVQAVQMRDPTKRVVVACPPERTSVQLREAAAAGFVIGRKKLQDSQLPHRVVTTGCGRRRGSFRWRGSTTGDANPQLYLNLAAVSRRQFHHAGTIIVDDQYRPRGTSSRRDLESETNSPAVLPRGSKRDVEHIREPQRPG